MNNPAPAGRRSRVHDPAGRRAGLLAAARRLFAANGYAGTSIRAIAAEADVSHALVITYFGSKEGLFMEAVGHFQIPRDALPGDIEGVGARIARAYMERWENMAEDDPWLALVRSSLSHEGSYRLLRSELEARQAAPLSAALGSAGDGPLRGAMVACLIAGVIMNRYIYRLESARSLSAAAFEAAFANSLQQAISGPAPAARRPVSEAPVPGDDPGSSNTGGTDGWPVAESGSGAASQPSPASRQESALSPSHDGTCLACRPLLPWTPDRAGPRRDANGHGQGQ